MKKTLLSIAAVLSLGLFAGCGMGTTGNAGSTTQSNGTADLLGAVAGSLLSGQTGVNANTISDAGSILGNIISTFGGNTATSQSSLIGTWTYQKPCVQFESESLLAKAGGSLIASKMESKLDSYYQKIGMKAGACKFVFAKDNTMQYTIGGNTYQGTYKFDSSKRQVVLTTSLGTSITAYVSINGNSMGLTFDSSKLLTLLKSASSLSSQLSTISSLSGSYTGMKSGFEFVR